MGPKAITKTIDIGDGHPITIETGRLAKQAHGSVVVRMGDTMLLAAVVSNQDSREGIDFLPLQVEYREKYASAGKFPGGFFKREARPSEAEILTCRLVDRALRPLFPNDYHSETQVHLMLMSTDKKNLPDSLACLAASAALTLSDIPFSGPVSEVRVARVDGKFIVNPRREELDEADMEMIIAGTAENIVMVEGEMQEVSESEMIEAIKVGHEAIKYHCKVQNDLMMEVGQKETRTYDHESNDEELNEAIKSACYDKCFDAAKNGASKEERKKTFKAIKEEFVASLSEEDAAAKKGLIGKYYHDVEKEAIRRAVLDEGIRLDGRKTDEIRPIWGEVDYLPGTHGSAIFTRGETQALMTLTIGSKMDEQSIDSPLVEGRQDFMLHYNFPPYSTGEARPIRGTSRREIGHGNLAQRALKAVVPGKPENPYTIRLVSEVLESNGSSSMATVCSGTMALMDGGINITRPVSGIAMGMISDPGGKYAILSDILGDEDHLGDMDFKVTGTSEGITACQMDIKVDGLSYEVLTEALEQAKVGRLHILDEMAKVINETRDDYKAHAPRMVAFEIPKESIGMVIGPGGSVIRELQEETGATIIIDEVDGKGTVQILSSDKDSLDNATNKIKMIAFPPSADVGEEYEGKIKTIMPYGAFVEVVPGTDGLLHISELEWHKVDRVEDVLKEGDLVKFKVIGKDPRSGKLKLSRKVLLPRPEQKEEQVDQ